MGVIRPYGIALDTAGGKMYWTNSGANKIQRASLDGSNVTDLITGLEDPYSIAVNAIPIPSAAWLLGSGLIGIVGIRRKFRN